ncbi:MBL fold metallo-hydrolase [Sphingomonas rubra]|uniref:L-ascorbate metabolism protein UlaG, beta-lactamase superfamily n=1 Tax=Sphingomonas rubra TaxID=634430 RepID=A0A1I5QNR4_9SPHN|nr:MBL fold metallo-hydrolase [Sphingomonas rubra]SFP47904.1 L-ascorbate metabolism protein UlaG, beta-lactamase superfamily [Sphingomonas rubra]
MHRIFILTGKAALFVVIAALLLSVIVPRYLDRIYYRGPASGHYDGERFFNPDGGDEGSRPPGGGGRLGFLWRNLTDDRPIWPDRVPVRQASAAELMPLPASTASASSATAAMPADLRAMPMRATWIGHASVLVQLPALNILTDPVWRTNTGPAFLGPTRVAAPGIAFDTLPKIDLVLVSHAHWDHLDLGTLKRLWDRDRPLIVTSPGNDAILRSAGIGAVAADWGRAVTVQERPRVDAAPDGRRAIRVHVTRNHHWSSRWFTDRNRALWSSFVVELPGGNLFFAGDTGLGDGRWPAEAARLGPIRLALIPIGAFRFVPGQMASDSHIGPVQAAQAYAGLGASSAIPIHWGTFRLSYEGYRTPPDLLRATLACTGQTGFDPVAIGRPVDVPALSARTAPPFPDSATVAGCLDTPRVRAMR